MRISILSFAVILVSWALTPSWCRAAEKDTPAKEAIRLRPLALQPLPLGAIRPKSWLLQQLKIQNNGLSGHLDEFWPDLTADNAWLGGKREGWERGPYWLDGVVPLAYLLDDPKLKKKVEHWMDYILTHQHEDGWLGPRENKGGPAMDPWPLFVLFKALIQYHEASGDKRVIPAMQKCVKRMDKLLTDKPLESWGQFRWADLVLSIDWLYDQTKDKSLLEFAAKVHKQGFDWQKHFTDFKLTDKVAKTDLSTHGVNTGMAVKTSGVWFRHSQDDADRKAVYTALANLDKYHGQASGIFTCDEHLAGRNPSQGTELCTVVETQFSLEMLESILGDPLLGDRLERITFNALPATFKPDMCAHQYDQQANQVVCKVSDPRIYTDNGPDSNLFGLEPNFGCCTANMHQGWPKFAAHLWMKTPDGGMAAIAYAPNVATTEIAGKKVQIELATDYPFDATLKFTVTAKEKVKFPLLMRIPAWADGAEVVLGDAQPQKARAGTFFRMDREWQGVETIEVSLPMPVKVRRGYHDSVAIERGPLVYSLKIDAEWKLLRGKEPFADWEVYPKSAWNYGLQLDVEHPEKSITFTKGKVGDLPFSVKGAPIQAKIKGKMLPDWKLEKNAAGPLPASPAASDNALEELTLIPYGCTSLRVTEFPLLK